MEEEHSVVAVAEQVDLEQELLFQSHLDHHTLLQLVVEELLGLVLGVETVQIQFLVQ